MKKLTTIILTIITICVFSLVGCKKTSEIAIYAPDGAPALALSSIMKQNLENVSVNIIGSDKIQSVVTGDSKKADVCILPINMASNLIGSGSDYKMLGTITHGNFYFLSKNEMVVNVNNLSLLKGEVVGVLQLKNVPGLTLKAVLNKNNVEYKEIADASEKEPTKVNLMAINKVEATRKDVDLFLIPSPQADNVEKNTSLKIVGSLGELYSENGFPQAIVVAKKSVIEKNAKSLKEIVSHLTTVNTYFKEENIIEVCSLIESKLESGLTPTFNKTNLTVDSIDRSNISFVSMVECKEQVEEFIDLLISVEPNSVKKFNSDFYYLGEL